MQQDWGIIFAFGLYFLALFGIGIFHMKKEQDLAGYVLGGRKVGPWVSAMSAEASDMSGWMLMGLPGYAYVAGVSAFWIAIGLAIGTWLNWLFVAKRLRVYTKIANDSITLPDFFENRFRDKTKILRVVSAIFIFIFFLIYTASGFVAGGRLFNTVFGLPYFESLLITAGIVVFYTFTGGYVAVCRTDFFQGCLMFFAIIIVPVTGIFKAGGPVTAFEKLYNMNANYFSFFTDATGVTLSATAIISLLAWGLGYFGQPHILVRFMAIRTSGEIRRATHIAMTWVVLSLAAAVAVGMVGRVYLTEPLTGTASETVFLVMTNELFPPIAAGLILSAVLAAIMSTASSQLLVAASAFAQDFYRTLIHKDAEQSELVWISRASVLVIASLAIFLGFNPNSFILDMVSYAWAGFGAAFGPAILMSLFWKRTTRNGVIAGIIVGGVTVLVWKQFALFGLYEIVPGFLLSLLAIYGISLLGEPPAQDIQETFDAVGKSRI